MTSDPVHFCRLRSLYYGHRTIKDHFSDGSPLEELAFEIVAGDVETEDMDPLVVQKIDGKRFVIDGNRRLCVFLTLKDWGYDVGRVPVVYTRRSEDRVLVEEDEGSTVRIRGRGSNEVEREIRRNARIAQRRT